MSDRQPRRSPPRSWQEVLDENRELRARLEALTAEREQIAALLRRADANHTDFVFVPHIDAILGTSYGAVAGFQWRSSRDGVVSGMSALTPERIARIREQMRRDIRTSGWKDLCEELLDRVDKLEAALSRIEPYAIEIAQSDAAVGIRTAAGVILTEIFNTKGAVEYEGGAAGGVST